MTRRLACLPAIGLGLLALACDASPDGKTSGSVVRPLPPASPAAGPRLDGVPSLVDDTIWRFPSGATVPSRLRAGITYIGRIEGEGGPYLLAAGVECNYCDADLTVLLQPVADSTGHVQQDVPGWYVYPGPIRSTGTGSIAMETRLFWGRCLPGRAPGLLQFATEYDTVGALKRRIVRYTEVRDGRLVDDSISASPPDLSAPRPAIDAGTCREVPQQEQMSAL